jgi:predicted protein tyrosine phosphatase
MVLGLTAWVEFTPPWTWADVIFVMEKRLERLLRRGFGPLLAEKTLVNLHIPDDYQHMEPTLLALLTERLTAHLGPPLNEGS